MTIFNKGRESLSFVYEDYLVDGEPERDYFRDPIEVLDHRPCLWWSKTGGCVDSVVVVFKEGAALWQEVK